MREKNNKTGLIISLLVIVFLVVVLAYLFSDKLFLSRNTNYTDTSDGNVTCMYNKLKSNSELTTSDYEEIADAISKNNDGLDIDLETVSVSLNNNEYVYKVEFELSEKVGSYKLEDYFWKENGIWKSLGAGSMHPIDEIQNITSKICNSCGNCAINNTCSFEVLSDPSGLSQADKNEIVTLIESRTENNQVDLDTLKISSYDKNIYKVDFELKDKTGSYVLLDYVWKENGIWKSLGAGSDFDNEQIETLQGVISASCNK